MFSACDMSIRERQVYETQGTPSAPSSGIWRPVHEHIVTMIRDDYNFLFLQE